MTQAINTKRNIIEMFIDRTAGERYSSNRLVTRETDGGNVALIAYGWLKLAEYNERRNAVTVFRGHTHLGSRTVTRYLNDVQRVAGERREVIVSGESPVVGKPNDGTEYIGEYVSFTDKSAVEKKVVRSIERGLRYLA